jgi:hypothetical protein
MSRRTPNIITASLSLATHSAAARPQEALPLGLPMERSVATRLAEALRLCAHASVASPRLVFPWHHLSSCRLYEIKAGQKGPRLRMHRNEGLLSKQQW